MFIKKWSTLLLIITLNIKKHNEIISKLLVQQLNVIETNKQKIIGKDDA